MNRIRRQLFGVVSFAVVAVFSPACKTDLGKSPAGAPTSFTQIPEAAQHYQKGLSAEQMGNYAEALTELRKAIDIDPYFARAHLELGHVLKSYGVLSNDHVTGQGGFFEQAHFEFRQALRYDPSLVEAREEMAVALQFQGKIQEAKDILEKLIDERPDSASALTRLGVIEMQTNALDLARDHVQKGIAISPNEPRAHYTLALIYDKLGDNAKSRDAAMAAIRLDPSSFDYYAALGSSLVKLDDQKGAEVAFCRALSLNPNQENSAYLLARVYMKLGWNDRADIENRRFEQIKKTIEQAVVLETRLRKDTQDQDARFALADIYGRGANKLLATGLLRDFLAARPDDVNAMVRLAEVHTDLRQFAAALDQINRAINADPVHARALLARARIRMTTGDIDGAASDAAGVLKVDPAGPEARLLLARVDIVRGRLNEALSSLASLEESGYQGADLYDLVGIGLYRQEKLPQATEAFKKDLDRDASDFYSHYYLGAMAAREKAWDQAREHLDRAAMINPFSVDALRQLQQVYTASGDNESAARATAQLERLEGLMAARRKPDGTSDADATQSRSPDTR